MSEAFVFTRNSAKTIADFVRATRGRPDSLLVESLQVLPGAQVKPFIVLDDPYAMTDDDGVFPRKVEAFNWNEANPIEWELIAEQGRVTDPLGSSLEYPETGRYQIDVATFYEGVPSQYDRLTCLQIGYQWYAFGCGTTFITPVQIEQDQISGSIAYELIPDKTGITYAQEFWGIDYTPALQWVRHKRQFFTSVIPCLTGL